MVYEKNTEICDMLILKQVVHVAVTVFYRASSFKPVESWIFVSNFSASNTSALQQPICACAKLTSFLCCVTDSCWRSIHSMHVSVIE
jgi:hypothetical protein